MFSNHVYILATAGQLGNDPDTTPIARCSDRVGLEQGGTSLPLYPDPQVDSNMYPVWELLILP